MIEQGQIVQGSLFNEPMRVETIRQAGPDAWALGLVGLKSERFRSVTLSAEDLKSLRVSAASYNYTGDVARFRLGLQAYSLGIANEFDPYFGLSISRVDPLPHQLEAVYDYLLKLARVRFLLADDAGAGKTIMAGLLIRELKLRGLAERTLIVCPANLTFQWQRELKGKFHEKFTILKGSDIKEQYGINEWHENRQILTSLDLAKRQDILPGLRQVHWDLVIVDEAHRMSATDDSHKSLRYRLGELLRETADHLLLLTATPHKGDAENFSLFMQLLDQDAFADVRSIRQAMEQRRAPFYLRRTKEAMVYFPERQADGEWAARKIFTKRVPHTADFTILVATEAAGEGINLQCCHVLFNYDIPWNPNRLEQRMGRIHRYGQTEDRLIFNFVATNTSEGRVLQTLLEKLRQIRDALDDDAVFNVVGEVLPAAQIERALRAYSAGELGREDLEDRLLRDVKEDRFRAICQNALEGLATKSLNLAMLVERRAGAQERRVVPETFARFIREAAGQVGYTLKPVASLLHTFDPGPTPVTLRQYERADDWRPAPLANRYPRLSTDRESADTHSLEWVTPGHPLFEALRRSAWDTAGPVLSEGACFHSVEHEAPARIDYYRARAVNGLGHMIHERLFAVEVTESDSPRRREPGVLGNYTPGECPGQRPDPAAPGTRGTRGPALAGQCGDRMYRHAGGDGVRAVHGAVHRRRP